MHKLLMGEYLKVFNIRLKLRTLFLDVASREFHRYVSAIDASRQIVHYTRAPPLRLRQSIVKLTPSDRQRQLLRTSMALHKVHSQIGIGSLHRSKVSA